ncbi:MAG: LysR family transcriptional regulator [Selenomonadaceae bacterium]
MEIRVLKYFMAVANEGSFTRAAERLHISQPTLSRQLHDMEEMYGAQLFIREPRHVRLTEEGLLLKRRAEEILALVDTTEQELFRRNDDVSGDIAIGAGESIYFKNVLAIISDMRRSHPGIHAKVITADAEMNLYLLERGLIDFAFAYGDLDPARYEALPLPYRDQWGVFLRNDDPLTVKSELCPDDIAGRDLVLSRQVVSDSTHGDDMKRWLGKSMGNLNISGTYTMAYNGALMVTQGIGIMLTFLHLVDAASLGLAVRPLSPAIYAQPRIVWKRHQTFSKASQLFLEKLQENLALNQYNQ